MSAFTSTRKDALFLADVAEAVVQTCADANLTVRVRASWALGECGSAKKLVAVLSCQCSRWVGRCVA